MNAPTKIASLDDHDREELRREYEAMETPAEVLSAKRHAGATWFNNLSISRKLLLATGAPLGGLLLITLFVFLSATDLELAEKLRWPALAICVYAFLNGILFARRMYVDSIQPLKRIAENMNRLATGDQVYAIEHIERQDEIGELARSTEVFAKAGIQFAEMRAARKEGEKRRKEGVLQLSNSFENSVGAVAGGVATASSQLKSTAGDMARAAERSSEQSSVVAQAMEEASSGFTAAAAASDEFAMSISEISRQAAQSAELARKASDSTGEADETISALSVSAEQVGEIVELIQSIAQRTNLLALNASIEAARGGEAGRGFAVVAAEVKELAAQTSRATQDVADQITGIQQSTGASVAALRNVGEQVKLLESTAISIASAVDQQSVASQDLARSIDQAALSTDEVRTNILAVRDTALTTGAAASQLLNSATELEGQAGELRTESDNFLSQIRSSVS